MIEVKIEGNNWVAYYRFAGSSETRRTYPCDCAERALKSAWQVVGWDKPALIFPRSAK